MIFYDIVSPVKFERQWLLLFTFKKKKKPERVVNTIFMLLRSIKILAAPNMVRVCEYDPYWIWSIQLGCFDYIYVYGRTAMPIKVQQNPVTSA